MTDRQPTVGQDLASVWEDTSRELGDQPALIQGSRVVSWRDFDDRSARLASALEAMGLAPGAVVAIDMYNCPEFFEVFFAAIKVGLTPTMVNYRYRSGELRHLLSDAGAAVVIAHPELAGAVLEIAPTLDSLGAVIEVGPQYEELISSHEPAVHRPDREPGIMLSFTGGTTGLPRGVVYGIARLTAQTLGTRSMITGLDIDPLAPAVDVVRDLRSRKSLPVCCPASPLMHSTAFAFASLPVLVAGGAVVTLEDRRFDAARLVDALDRHGVTSTAVVGDAFARPLVAELDERAAAGRPFDGFNLRVLVSAGVALSADTKRRLLDHVPGLSIVDACGATEGTTYGVAVARVGDALESARFEPAPGTMVVDDQRRPVPDGTVGLISALTVCSGYHNDPDATSSRFYDDGPERRAIPGDFGRIELDGRLTLLGRGTAVINTGGEKVHPEEVEDVIKRLAGVIDVVVWRVPDERLGSVVGAVVQVLSESGLTGDEVRRHVREALAGFKAPRRVVMVDEMPRLTNGKVDIARLDALLGVTAR